MMTLDDHGRSSTSNQCAYSHPLDYIVEPDWRQTGESWFLLYFSLLVTKCVIGLLTLWNPSPGRNRFPILSNLCLNSQNIDNWRWPILTKIFWTMIRKGRSEFTTLNTHVSGNFCGAWQQVMYRFNFLVQRYLSCGWLNELRQRRGRICVYGLEVWHNRQDYC